MFISVKVNSWKQAKEIFAERSLWAFRGQNNETWYPESSLFRQAIRASYPLDHIHNRELWILKAFQRFAHHYINNLPPENAILDWLSLLQHYGAPTRLVDFTYSFYIATFFAIEKADSDAAIWAVNFDDLDYYAEQFISYNKSGNIHDINLKNVDEFNQIFNNSNQLSFVLRVQPDQMHERLWNQQGLFLAPTNPTQTFIENLASALNIKTETFYSSKPFEWTKELDGRFRSARTKDVFPNQVSVVKLILPKHIHYDIGNDLHAMNISAATLFPGLEGFARSMYYHLNTSPGINDVIAKANKPKS